MEIYAEYNDGGSKTYKSKDSKYYITECHSMIFRDDNTNDTNENYYITGNGNDISFCSYKKTSGLNHICLDNKLAIIVDYDNTSKFRENYDARLITDGNISSWDIYNGSMGWYAIIKTDDKKVIDDFKKWFNAKNSNYKYLNIYENWYVFISDGNLIDFRILNDCIVG